MPWHNRYLNVECAQNFKFNQASQWLNNKEDDQKMAENAYLFRVYVLHTCVSERLSYDYCRWDIFWDVTEFGLFHGKYCMRKYLEEEFFSFKVPFLTVIIPWSTKLKVAEHSFHACFCWCDSARTKGLQKKHVNSAIILFIQNPHYLRYFSPTIIECSVLMALVCY